MSLKHRSCPFYEKDLKPFMVLSHISSSGRSELSSFFTSVSAHMLFSGTQCLYINQLKFQNCYASRELQGLHMKGCLSLIK